MSISEHPVEWLIAMAHQSSLGIASSFVSG